MARPDRDRFLDGAIVVEEKLDGANVGLSVSGAGEVRAQNRGNYLSPGAHPQFGPLWGWIAERERELREALQGGLVVFGEWCYAVHSVRYSALPDWFVAFDVYDRTAGRFYSTQRRDRLLATLRAQSAPRIGQGHFDLEALVRMMDERASAFGAPKLEGLYLRKESADWLESRAKLVRPDFVQQISEHWSRRPLEVNRLSPG